MNDIASSSKPPVPVATSVALHAASFFIGFANLFLTLGVHTVARVVAWSIAIGIIYIYLKAIYTGRNWVRWLSIILSFTGALWTPSALQLRPTPLAKEIYIVQVILVLAASVLLLLPASAKWFRPNNSFKPKPLRGSA